MSDLSPQAEALLEISRAGDDPTGRDRTRVRNALAGRIALGVAAGAAVATISKTAATATTSVATATAATATAATAATATVATAASTGVGAGAAAGAGISGLAAKLLLSAALVGAVGAGTVTYTHRRADEARTSAALEVAKPIAPGPLARRAPSPANVEAPEATAEVSAPVPVETLPAAPAPMRVTGPIAASPIVARPSEPRTPVIDAPVVTTAPVEAPAKASSLTEEIALLQDAHAALQSGSAERALGILDEHARRFPRGTLTEEREASRVSALCKLGRADEARTQAADFLRDHPRSPQAPAVRASCAFDAK